MTRMNLQFQKFTHLLCKFSKREPFSNRTLHLSLGSHGKWLIEFQQFKNNFNWGSKYVDTI